MARLKPFTPESNENGACDCPYKRSCHTPRQWLQAKIRSENGTTIEASCPFYPLLKGLYADKGYSSPSQSQNLSGPL